MFCPNCGKADQKELTYCRQCGEYLPDLAKKRSLSWGGPTPESQVTTTLVFNLLCAVISLIAGILLIQSLFSQGDKTFIISLAASLLLLIGLWQVSNFFVGMKLRRHFKNRNSEAKSPEFELKAPDTKDLLPEADFRDLVPPSVTERTTTRLKEPRR